jgi:hypothetical protein
MSTCIKSMCIHNCIFNTIQITLSKTSTNQLVPWNGLSHSLQKVSWAQLNDADQSVGLLAARIDCPICAPHVERLQWSKKRMWRCPRKSYQKIMSVRIRYLMYYQKWAQSLSRTVWVMRIPEGKVAEGLGNCVSYWCLSFTRDSSDKHSHEA